MAPESRRCRWEQWGRPVRSRVPLATEPAMLPQTASRSTGGDTAVERPLAGPGRSAERTTRPARPAGEDREAASALRDRQQASLRAAVDLALAEGVDAVVIAGDLFDDNTVSARTVGFAVAELERLAAGRIPVVLLPGDHDAYTRSSVYRAHDLPALVGPTLTVLTPDRPWVHLESLDAVVVGLAELTGSETLGDLGGLELLPAATWRIGLLHAAVGDGPGEVSPGSLEKSGVDAVLLGHAHVAASGRAGKLVWAAAGAPEQVAADRDKPGTVNLVTLDEVAGAKHVAVETRVVGSTRHL
ncbi:MAG TPA: DNA repair exonuclease, partial [Candidatus Limnocylindrales bacterium]